jgi:hypothetical protein
MTATVTPPSDQSSDAPRPRRWTRVIIISVAALAVLGLGYWIFAFSTFELDGTITVTGPGITTYGATTPNGCSGYSGYSDMNAGTSVTVYDDAGKVVALGALKPGIYSGNCQFPFAVQDVPTGSKFYSVEVSHRGRVTITEDAAKNGQAAFTLGSAS